MEEEAAMAVEEMPAATGRPPRRALPMPGGPAVVDQRSPYEAYYNVTPDNIHEAMQQAVDTMRTSIHRYDDVLPKPKGEREKKHFTEKHNPNLESATIEDLERFNVARQGILANAITYLPVKSNDFLKHNVDKFNTEAEAKAQLRAWDERDAHDVNIHKRSRMTVTVNRKTHAKKYIVKSGRYYEVQAQFQRAHPGYARMLQQRAARINQQNTYQGRYLPNNVVRIAPGYQLTVVKRNEGAGNLLTAGAVGGEADGIDHGNFFLALKPLSTKHKALKKWTVLFDHKHAELGLAPLGKAWLPRVSGGQRGHKMRQVYVATVDGVQSFVAFKKEHYTGVPSKHELVVYGEQEVGDGIAVYKEKVRTTANDAGARLMEKRREHAAIGYLLPQECSGWLIMKKIGKYGMPDNALSFKPIYSRSFGNFVMVNVGVLKSHVPILTKDPLTKALIDGGRPLVEKSTFVFSKRKASLTITGVDVNNVISFNAAGTGVRAMRGRIGDRTISLSMPIPHDAADPNRSPSMYRADASARVAPTAYAFRTQDFEEVAIDDTIGADWLATWFPTGRMSAAAVATFIFIMKGVSQCLMQVRVTLGSRNMAVPPGADAVPAAWYTYVFPKPAGQFNQGEFRNPRTSSQSFPAVYAQKNAIATQLETLVQAVSTNMTNAADRAKLAKRHTEAVEVMASTVIP